MHHAPDMQRIGAHLHNYKNCAINSETTNKAKLDTKASDLKSLWGIMLVKSLKLNSLSDHLPYFFSRAKPSMIYSFVVKRFIIIIFSIVLMS